MPSFVEGKQRAKTETKNQVEKRVLAAEKVVVSSILHRWLEKWGMASAIVVLNEDGTIFSRFSGSEEQLELIKLALLELICKMDPTFPCAECYPNRE